MFSAPPTQLGGRSSTVYQALVRELDSGVYGNGDKLPTEKELCRRFDVSRTTVRKALGCLAETGRVAIRQGAGIYAIGIESIPDSRRPTTTTTVSVSMAMTAQAATRLQRRLLRAGLMPCLFNQFDQWWDPTIERLFLERVLDERHRAVIGMFSPRAPRNDDLFRALQAAGTQVVHLEPYCPSLPEQNYCLPDHNLAGYMAASELMLRGARDLVMLRMTESPFELLALAGFDRSAAAHRRADRLPDQWLGHSHTPELAAIAERDLRAWLATLPHGTGIFCRSRDNAADVCRVAAELGRPTTGDADLRVIALTDAGHDGQTAVATLEFDRDAMLETVIDHLLAPTWQPLRHVLPPVLHDPDTA